MGWSSPISSGDVVAIHAALVPTVNGDGEILLFGGDDHDLTAARLGEAGDIKQFDHTRRFNCRHPSQALEYVHSPAFDVFCCGHAFLGDGRFLIGGGTLKYPADAAGPHHNLHFEGHRHCAVYALEEQERYAAIWEKDQGPAFVARHGLTPQGYQQEFDHWVGQGFRLKQVSGYSAREQERYAAIWEKDHGPAFVARHGMTSQQYQQEFDTHVGQGFRLKLVSGYSVAGQDRYAAIWERSGGPEWIARHGMTSQQYQQEFDTHIHQGFRLKQVSGYSAREQERYAAIWEKDHGPAFVARHGMTSQQYQQEFDTHVGQGFRLKLVSGYSVAGQERYAAIWEKSPGPDFVARHGLSAQAYQREFDHWVGQGFRLRLVSGYGPAIGAFTNVADMGPEPGHGQAGGGRWYPTLCTLPTGEVLAFQGHPKGDDTRHSNNTPERYHPSDRWVGLPPIGDTSDPIVYPRLHLLNDGNVFVSSLVNGFNGNLRFNPFNGGAQVIAPLPDPDYLGFACASVLLPLVPADGYRPRVLLCGGLRSQILDLGNLGAGWQVVPRNGTTANLPRYRASATLLPTGDVLLTGGTRIPDPSSQDGVMEPELYTTPLNRQQGTYTNSPGRWDTINEPATVLRNYHSTALLMPDGRVWTAGGNSAEQPGMPPTTRQKLIEIYDPPYPAGPRPTINSCPSLVFIREEFTVGVARANRIGSVVLLRCGSSTHTFNPDQRAVWLQFRVTGPNTLAAIAPPNADVVPPGPYMLFVVDKDGRPCQYARFIQVGNLVDDGSRYAAVWMKDNGAPFVARHGMTSQQYQQEFDTWVGRGYVLTLVNGYALNDQDHYAAIWEQKSAPPFVARHGLSSQSYQQEFNNLVGQGYRLKLVSGYGISGQDRYAAIWEKSSGPEWVARHGMTSQQYQREFDTHVGQGFRLKLVSGYSVAGQERYAAIWEKDNGPAFVARHGMTSQQCQQEFDTFVGRQGYRLVWVCGYRHGPAERYAAIWDKSRSPAWVARHGMSSPAYQHEFNKWVVEQGFRLVQVSGY
jgi:triacylglycerol esterase/lipase EstA (alpha/beta hydrolase family)